MARAPRFIQLYRRDADAVRAEIAGGLTAATPWVAPKHFYDGLGCRLFEAITELAEYYPTRTEAVILALHGRAIGEAIGHGAPLVDLGAGNCAKAASLFGLLRPSRYVAVDIAVDFLQGSLRRLQPEYPDLDLLGVGLDFSGGLVLPPEAGDGPRTLFYPGSSIGNFTPAQALSFLTDCHRASQGGHLLIGVDLVKPLDVLVRAYDDDLGVTAAFNRNVLRNLNAQLASDFDVRDWEHRALYDEAQGRIEMHLEARRPLRVTWPGGERRFETGQRLHTENSHKYRAERFEALLREAGFRDVRLWTDARRWFAVFVGSA
jgi:dimethylhistidine N-methyltransferase